jgi:hypothetical protein
MRSSRLVTSSRRWSENNSSLLNAVVFSPENGKQLCPPCAVLKDNVDVKSLAAVTQAQAVSEKIEAWQNAN